MERRSLVNSTAILVRHIRCLSVPIADDAAVFSINSLGQGQRAVSDEKCVMQRWESQERCRTFVTKIFAELLHQKVLAAYRRRFIEDTEFTLSLIHI